MAAPLAVQAQIGELVGGPVIADQDDRRGARRVVGHVGVVAHRLRERQQHAGIKRHDGRVGRGLRVRVDPAERHDGRPGRRAPLVLDERRDERIVHDRRLRLLPFELDVEVEVLERLRQLDHDRERARHLVWREGLPGEAGLDADAEAERADRDAGPTTEAELARELRRPRGERGASADPAFERDPRRTELPAVAPAHRESGVDAAGVQHEPRVGVEEREELRADARVLRRVLANPEVPGVAAVEVEERLGAGRDLDHAREAPRGVDAELQRSLAAVERGQERERALLARARRASRAA